MSGLLDSYALADFVPFTAEVYQRLFERLNEAGLALPALTLAAGAGAAWAAWRGRSGPLGVLLAASWAWVGWAFFLRLYTPLNWAGEYLAWACFGQAALLLAMGARGRLGGARRARAPVILVAVAGVALPAAECLLGRGWAGFEVFGHAPEPTAAVTVALTLFAARPATLPVLVPLLVCGVGGATAYVFGHRPGLMLPALVLGLSLAAIVRDGARWARARQPSSQSADR